MYLFLSSVVSPYSFSIGNTSDMEPYLHGGIAVQVKTPKTFCFVSVHMVQYTSFQMKYTSFQMKMFLRGRMRARVVMYRDV